MYHLFGYFLHRLSKEANVSLETLKKIYIFNALDQVDLIKCLRNCARMNQSLFLIYNQCRLRPECNFSPVYRHSKPNPFEPKFNLECKSFELEQLYLSQSRILFIYLENMNDTKTVIVSWIDSLLDELHEPKIFQNENRYLLIESIWSQTLSYLNPKYQWHIVVTYKSNVDRTELNCNFIIILIPRLEEYMEKHV